MKKHRIARELGRRNQLGNQSLLRIRRAQITKQYMGGSLTQTAARNRKGLKGLENKPQTKKVKGSLVNKLVSPDKYILEQGKQEYCKTKQTLETIETLTPEETKEDLQWLHNLKDSFDSLQISDTRSIPDTSLECFQKILKEELELVEEINYKVFNLSYPSFSVSGPDCLHGTHRIVLIDWLSSIATSLTLKRETVHLAVSYIDAYIEAIRGVPFKLQVLGAGALLLAAKMEERRLSSEVLIRLASHDFLSKEQIIAMEQDIAMKLRFKLGFNTLPFWIDYFSMKWDETQTDRHFNRLFSINNPKQVWQLKLRHSQGLSYKYYRELCEIADSLIMDAPHRQYQMAKLALACIYLTIRVEIEIADALASCSVQSEEQALRITNYVWRLYHNQFQMSTSPIFRDQWRVNQVFTAFCCEQCGFELTDIIPSVKYVSKYVDLSYCFEIDSTLYSESVSYEQFIRHMTYSPQIKQHMLAKGLP